MTICVYCNHEVPIGYWTCPTCWPKLGLLDEASDRINCPGMFPTERICIECDGACYFHTGKFDHYTMEPDERVCDSCDGTGVMLWMMPFSYRGNKKNEERFKRDYDMFIIDDPELFNYSKKYEYPCTCSKCGAAGKYTIYGTIYCKSCYDNITEARQRSESGHSNSHPS